MMIAIPIGLVLWAVIFAIVIGCAPAPRADDKNPDGVRVQIYQDPRWGGKACLVLTHDTMQGVSIAVTC